MSGVAFNSEHDDMLAYSGAGSLSIRTATFQPQRQRVDGLVVAFCGAKVYCLHGATVREEDVPLSSTMQQYADIKAWDGAYGVACLGVTQQDWAALGQAALSHLELDTARKAYIRTQDLLMLNLVHRLEVLVKSGVVSDVLKGEVLAYQVRNMHHRAHSIHEAHAAYFKPPCVHWMLILNVRTRRQAHGLFAAGQV